MAMRPSRMQAPRICCGVRRGRALWPRCCGGSFKAGLCRVGRDDRRQSQVREVYVNQVCRHGRRKSRTVDTLELRLRLNSRYWAKYPEGCRFAGIGASGDEKPVEFGNKQRSSCAGYGRDVGRAAVDVPLRLEHIHISVAAAEVNALALRIEEEIVGITTRTHGGNRAAVPHGEHA